MKNLESNDLAGAKDRWVDFAKLGMAQAGEWAPERMGPGQSSRIGVGFETLDRFMFDPAKAYPHLKGLGVDLVRVQTGWCRCETVKGAYDFAWLDSIVDNLIAVGTRVLFSVSYGNALYMKEANHPSAVGHVPLYFGEEARKAWLNYVDALAGHFAGRVSHWEIWNEPNIAQFWFPETPSGRDYAELVRITAPRIRAQVKDARIVGISTCGIAPTLLEEALQAGVGEWLDACSFHPYQAVPEDNLQTMHDATRYLLNKYVPGRGIEIWQGENGCPSQADSHEVFSIYNMDEQIHAKWVARRVMADLKVNFARSFYFHMVDLVDVPYRLSDGKPGKPLIMGLLRGKEYQPKPAYFVFRRLCHLFDNDSERADLFCSFYNTDSRKPAQCGLLGTPMQVCFVRNGIPLIAYWLSEDPQQAIGETEIHLGFWPGSGQKITDPVLLDVMSGNYYSLKDRMEPFKGGLRFHLPLADYPLVLTDRSALRP